MEADPKGRRSYAGKAKLGGPESLLDKDPALAKLTMKEKQERLKAYLTVQAKK